MGIKMELIDYSRPRTDPPYYLSVVGDVEVILSYMENMVLHEIDDQVSRKVFTAIIEIVRDLGTNENSVYDSYSLNSRFMDEFNLSIYIRYGDDED